MPELQIHSYFIVSDGVGVRFKEENSHIKEKKPIKKRKIVKRVRFVKRVMPYRKAKDRNCQIKNEIV